MKNQRCGCQEKLDGEIDFCALHGAALKLRTAGEAVLDSLGHVMKEMTEQGIDSAAFASRADEIAAAFRDLRSAVKEAKGGAA